MTDNLIPITYTSDRPTVSGRELHDALEVATEYKKWFSRMAEYGFTDGIDYEKVTQKCLTSSTGQNITDHQLTLDMAKELCMLQRTEKGRECRRYFIAVEKRWNSPEAIMSRALRLANRQLEALTGSVKELEQANAVQAQQLSELQPKASYYDLVLNCKDLISISAIAKDYGWSARKMNAYLHERGVQFKQGAIWLLYQKYAEKGYTSTKTSSYPGSDGAVHSKVHTYWTQKGRLFLYGLLKADGVLPLIEREEGEETA